MKNKNTKSIVTDHDSKEKMQADSWSPSPRDEIAGDGIDGQEKVSTSGHARPDEHWSCLLEESLAREDFSSSIGRRIAKNFFSLSSATIICKILAFVSTAYVARTLSTEGFGVIGFAQAIFIYFQLLINQGLDIYGTREIARRPSEIRLYASNIVTIRLILASIAYGLVIVLAALIPKPMVVKATILILGVRLFELTFNLKWVFQGIEKMEWIAISRIIQQALYVCGVFIFVHEPSQILRVPLLLICTAIMGALFLLVRFWRMYGTFKLSINIPFWKDIFRQSIPMATSSLLIQIYLSFDMIMLGFIHGEHTVGLYSATYKVITMINMFGIYYFLTLFPNISRLYITSHEKMLSLLSKSLRQVVMIAVPLAVGGAVLAEPIIELIYGANYSDSALPLKILIWNVCIIWISLHYGNTLIACNRQKRYLAGVSIGAISNIILNLIFIPKYGMTAAAFTTIFAEIIVLAFMYRELRRIIPLSFFAAVPKPLFAAFFMGAAVYLLPDFNVIARVAIGMAIYGPLLYLTGGLGQDDLKRLTAFLPGKK